MSVRNLAGWRSIESMKRSLASRPLTPFRPLTSASLPLSESSLSWASPEPDGTPKMRFLVRGSFGAFAKLSKKALKALKNAKKMQKRRAAIKAKNAAAKKEKTWFPAQKENSTQKFQQKSWFTKAQFY